MYPPPPGFGGRLFFVSARNDKRTAKGIIIRAEKEAENGVTVNSVIIAVS